MSKQIDGLNFNDSTYAGRKITQLMKALENIEQYQEIAANKSIRFYLEETRADLKHMMKIVLI